MAAHEMLQALEKTLEQLQGKLKAGEAVLSKTQTEANQHKLHLALEKIRLSIQQTEESIAKEKSRLKQKEMEDSEVDGFLEEIEQMGDILGEGVKLRGEKDKDDDLASLTKEELIALVLRLRALITLEGLQDSSATKVDSTPKSSEVVPSTSTPNPPSNGNSQPPHIGNKDPINGSSYGSLILPKDLPPQKNATIVQKKVAPPPPQKNSSGPVRVLPAKVTPAVNPNVNVATKESVSVVTASPVAPPVLAKNSSASPLPPKQTVAPVKKTEPASYSVAGELPPASKETLPPPAQMYANTPYENIEETGWYFGKIDRKQAEEILQKGGVGHYIARESSQKGSYAISYWHKDFGINHTLIIPSGDGGYRFQDENDIYPSVLNLVRSCPKFVNMMPIPKDIVATPEPSYGVLRRYQ